MSKVAFCIEGYNSKGSKHGFPELDAALGFASANKCDVFDAIESYNEPILSQAYKEFSPEQVMAHLLVTFSKEGGSDVIINHIILPPLKKAVTEGLPPPSWMNNLSSDTIGALIRQTLEKDFHGDVSAMKAQLAQIHNRITDISNNISREQFIDYVRQHKDVEEVYAMIGAKHSPFLDPAATVVAQTENARELIMNIEDREIRVHLVGGKHGHLQHYDDLVSVVCKHHPEFKIPSTSRRVSPLDQDIAKFEYWMTHWNHKGKPETSKGNPANRAKLFSWLSADMGAESVKTYQHFLDLADALSKRGWATTRPAPTEDEYNRAVELYRGGGKLR